MAAIGGCVGASLELRPERRQFAAGVGWALLAMLGFGGYYVLMHAASTQAGCGRRPLPLHLGGAGLVRRPPAARPPDRPPPPLVALIAIGLLDTGGNTLFAAASSSHGLLSVVAVLASLYPVVTVLLARFLLGERVQRTQHVGVAVALVGVVLITAGG